VTSEFAGNFSPSAADIDDGYFRREGVVAESALCHASEERHLTALKATASAAAGPAEKALMAATGRLAVA
jgi:hypothetical protein